MELNSYKLSSELHDDFKIVDSWVHNGSKWIEDIQQYYKERSSIEREYSQKLSSLSRKFVEKKNKKSSLLSVGENPTKSAGSLECASLTTWSKILDELEQSSKIHQKLADDFVLETNEQAKRLETNVENLTKSYDHLYEKFLEQKESLLTMVKRAKSSYHEACESLESARQKRDKHNDEKTGKLFRNSQSDMLDKKNMYILRILVYNEHMQRYYQETLPNLLDHMQRLNEYRVKNLNDTWKSGITCEKNCYKSLSEEADALISEIDKNEPSLDSVMFGQHNVKAWNEPSPLAFEPSPIWHDTDSLVVDGTSRNFLRNTLVNSKSEIQKAEEELQSLSKQLEGSRIDDTTALEQSYESKIAAVELESKEVLIKNRVHDLNVRVGKITEKAGNIEEGMNFHTFKVASFKIPVKCSYCHSKVWGRGLSCEDCGYKCHPRCQLYVPANCGQSPIEDDHDEAMSSTGDFGSNQREGSLLSSNLYDTYEDDYTNSVGSRNEYAPSLQQTPFNDSETIHTQRAEEEEKQVTGTLLYDFTGTQEGVLSASQGQTFTLLEPDNGSGWISARIGGLDGLLPSTYVELENNAAGSTNGTVETANEQYVKAAFDYEAQSELEITIREGDVIRVTQRDAGNGWSEGTLHGITGQFPANYVEDI
ncbi:diacylglycerol binding protein Bzz1 [Schizosaccharomyces octosporus yFS286]|uniref:Protein BZZ1 n=1 Tax=Schizosaccharomyces octosporus (strain yFS286) TaxID=483514 RepID=S9QW24_SCHOY|nr:diacylglycerol binding protein Bzz1 [Schizosaccharomyces octosporus yFS286]EPX70515.1 diacylglycerol binding protein Bzz1 [Schizosaccharomyces octosporus yFS286]